MLERPVNDGSIPPGSVSLRTMDGSTHELIHGDVIGRLWSAALHLNDGRISECHAMISNRGQELHLLALRGRFRVDGQVGREVVLEAGQRIELAPGVALEVVEVRRPEHVLGLEAPGLPVRIISGVVSLFGSPARLERGWKPSAESRVWPTGEGWMRSSDEGPVEIVGGSSWLVNGSMFHAVNLSTGVLTTLDNQLTRRLRIVARYDAVHVHLLPANTTLVLSGLSARLVSELVMLGQPIAWHSLASELWGNLPRNLLRKRWDMQISRLRRKFRGAGVRSDLVLADGTGLVQLVVGPADEIVDET